MFENSFKRIDNILHTDPGEILESLAKTETQIAKILGEMKKEV